MDSSKDTDETAGSFELLSSPNAQGKQDLPKPTATPAEVRDYLVHSLHSKGISRDDATEIASRWKYGSDRELRSYPIAMYRKTFGPDDEEVWLVYMAVKAPFYRKENQNNFTLREQASILTVSTAVFCIGVWMMVHHPNDPWIVVATLLLILGMVGAAFAIVDMCVDKDPEKKAERELQDHWRQKFGQHGDGPPKEA
ncbi:uncharacterized protein LTR77_004332 [Saxophila tyrrhenica]|uniref:Uncharacterized protein n=1 Tax=Saxophila tyrrhenica TaxID=1690608 RepID=A0AAV9PGE2_9PEZI|nr:hypothetical protein LTR77_004332 [Saxophila tyrrhenica]